MLIVLKNGQIAEEPLFIKNLIFNSCNAKSRLRKSEIVIEHINNKQFKVFTKPHDSLKILSLQLNYFCLCSSSHMVMLLFLYLEDVTRMFLHFSFLRVNNVAC